MRDDLDAADTIVALSSGAPPSGIAVVRVSGPAARPALEAVAGGVPEPRRASLRRLRDPASDETLDRGLALFFPGPRTATGEDLAEFHLHGGRAVVAAVLQVLCRLTQVRLAEPGEFTRRAFGNGRMDLTEVEGLADLLAAETEGQRRQAVRQAGGEARALYENWARRLLHARALIEAELDFSDEDDVAADVAARVAGDVASLRGDIERHLAGARRGELLREGFLVVIAGRPNAGKSSLLNALAGREAAIVSDVPGTTRDVIEVRLDLGGVPVRVMDTAGLRDTADAVERIGVGRARDAIREADLVLHLAAPGEDENGAVDGTETIRVATKADLGGAVAADHRISVRTGEGLEALVEDVARRAALAVGDPADVVPTRARHREILTNVERILGGADWARHPPEIAAETLRLAADRLGALTGRSGVEDLLGVVFGEFCIGK